MQRMIRFKELCVRSIRVLFTALMVLALHSERVCAQSTADRISIKQRAVTLAGGETIDYEVGTLFVPENRGKPNSRTIAIGFARIKALHPTGAPPVFWLPGGPGLDVLGAFTESGEAAQARLRSWLSFRPVGDLVIVGQRGYTTRGEKLVEMSGASPLDRPASVQAEARAMRALAIRAVAHHADKDLSGYTIEAFAADVDALRKSLRYDRISLFGGSFGSQWSLAVMRFHPEIVARAVLSSVEPLNSGYDMPTHVFGALQRIAYDADRDAGLAPYLPQGGVMEAVRALHRRFASQATPKVVRVVVVDEVGKRQVVALGKEDLQLALLSRTSDAARWPAFILSLYHGRYEDWARETLHDRRAAPVTLIGPLVDSSLGVTAEREHQMRTDPATDLLGTWNFESNISSASDWPTRDMGDSVRLPRVSPIPVVFVHGDWDTSTPIENTLGLLPYFPNGRAILVHRGGHDGAFYQLRQSAAAKEAIFEFLRTGQTGALPTEVSLTVPSFELPPFPAPSRAR
nr:alpha/beta hydrolase [uncultured Roseateles sp.]